MRCADCAQDWQGRSNPFDAFEIAQYLPASTTAHSHLLLMAQPSARPAARHGCTAQDRRGSPAARALALQGTDGVSQPALRRAGWAASTTAEWLRAIGLAGSVRAAVAIAALDAVGNERNPLCAGDLACMHVGLGGWKVQSSEKGIGKRAGPRMHE